MIREESFAASAPKSDPELLAQLCRQLRGNLEREAAMRKLDEPEWESFKARLSPSAAYAIKRSSGQMPEHMREILVAAASLVVRAASEGNLRRFGTLHDAIRLNPGPIDLAVFWEESVLPLFVSFELPASWKPFDKIAGRHVRAMLAIAEELRDGRGSYNKNDQFFARIRPILALLWKEGALCAAKTVSAENISTDLGKERGYKHTTLKRLLPQIRRAGLIQSAKGCGGGYWLTELGASTHKRSSR